MVHEMSSLFRQWRDGLDKNGQPAPSNRRRRERLSPYTGETTPPMGDMNDEQIERYAREICRRDMERTINRLSEQQAVQRAKRRAGEAA